jgi:membrane-associated phospholipid phosphatase
VTALAAGIAAPLVRRRLRLPPPVVTATAATAPVALCILFPRTRARDVGACVLQMWAYVATYEMPNDDPAALERRVRVAYPVRVDRALGRGTTPTLRLQRALGTPGRFTAWEKALVWSHWLWFLFPHGTVVFLLLRHRDRFPRGAAQVYATFDLGLIGYWAVPTAPPWYAARKGLMADGRTPELRRMMVEYGEHFWGTRWTSLYGVLGGNPLAAMPSLHFATSVTSAHLLAETGRGAGLVGWAYVATLGVALVYLGEHYVVDLAAGLALAETVRAATPLVAPAVQRASETVRALEALARG